MAKIQKKKTCFHSWSLEGDTEFKMTHLKWLDGFVSFSLIQGMFYLPPKPPTEWDGMCVVLHYPMQKMSWDKRRHEHQLDVWQDKALACTRLLLLLLLMAHCTVSILPLTEIDYKSQMEQTGISCMAMLDIYKKPVILLNSTPWRGDIWKVSAVFTDALEQVFIYLLRIKTSEDTCLINALFIFTEQDGRRKGSCFTQCRYVVECIQLNVLPAAFHSKWRRKFFIKTTVTLSIYTEEAPLGHLAWGQTRPTRSNLTRRMNLVE